MEGVIFKKGGFGNREWQKRYFRVSADNPQILDYYLSSKHVNTQGSINLSGAKLRQLQGKGKKIIEVCSASSYIISYLMLFCFFFKSYKLIQVENIN